jgi:hypothetical protein
VVHQPGGRFGRVVGQQARRVLADEVVEHETARPGLAQHARQRQLGEHLARALRLKLGHARRGGGQVKLPMSPLRDRWREGQSPNGAL